MFPIFGLTIVGTTLALYVLSAIVAVGAGVLAWKKFITVDQEVIERRKAAGHLAGTLKGFGLVKIPAFLIEYSTGDYIGMAEAIHDMAKDAMAGEDKVVAELKGVFDNVLTAVLKTDAGRALVAAKLADASKPSDPSSVAAAPQATTSPSSTKS